jgi:hypothetical protein
MINNKWQIVKNKLNKREKTLARQVWFGTLTKEFGCVVSYTLSQSRMNNI